MIIKIACINIKIKLPCNAAFTKTGVPNGVKKPFVKGNIPIFIRKYTNDALIKGAAIKGTTIYGFKTRSEERRVGKEWRGRRWTYDQRRKDERETTRVEPRD